MKNYIKTMREKIGHDTLIVVGAGMFSGKNMMYTYPNGDKVCTFGIIYVCRDFSGELLPETDETSELRWFEIDNLPNNINPPDTEPMTAFVDYIKRTNLVVCKE